MEFTLKAVLFAEDSAFFNFLKSFLFKYGLRETEVTRDPRDIAKFVSQNIWPIIFVDHSEGFSDALPVFEGIYKTRGFELLPFIFVAPQEATHFDLVCKVVGGRGVLRKPLQPREAEKMLQGILPRTDDKVTFLALQASKLVIAGDYEKAIPALNKLATIKPYERPAKTALLRCEIQLGHYKKAEERVSEILRANPKDVRAICDYCEILRRRSQSAMAIKYYKMIRSIHPEMTLTIWDHLLLHLELDEVDEAVMLLNELHRGRTYRELSTELLTRIMLYMGLEEHIPGVLRSYPALGKKFSSYVESLKLNQL